jgi:hypothetical protein
MKKALSLLVLLPLLLAACERDTTYDELAQCITDSGAIYYGSFTCHNCADQEELFGDSKDLLPYVECTAGGPNAQPELCTEAGVTGTPTWDFADGTRLIGLQPIETLAEATNCPLPGEEVSVLFQSGDDESEE